MSHEISKYREEPFEGEGLPPLMDVTLVEQQSFIHDQIDFFSQYLSQKEKEEGLNSEQVADCLKAAYELSFEYAKLRFEEQSIKENKDLTKRSSGDHVMTHPNAILISLLNQGLRDPEVVAAIMLHDVVEDTDVTNEDIENQFGERVAGLVDKVTKVKSNKLSAITGLADETILADPDENQDSLSKLYQSLIDDVNALFIKQGDVAHNQMTSDALRDTQSKRNKAVIGKFFIGDTARRLGLEHQANATEEGAARTLFPELYASITQDYWRMFEENTSVVLALYEDLVEIYDVDSMRQNLEVTQAHFIWPNSFEIAAKTLSESRAVPEREDYMPKIKLVTSTSQEILKVYEQLLEVYGVSNRDKIINPLLEMKTSFSLKKILEIETPWGELPLEIQIVDQAHQTNSLYSQGANPEVSDPYADAGKERMVRLKKLYESTRGIPQELSDLAVVVRGTSLEEFFFQDGATLRDFACMIHPERAILLSTAQVQKLNGSTTIASPSDLLKHGDQITLSNTPDLFLSPRLYDQVNSDFACERFTEYLEEVLSCAETGKRGQRLVSLEARIGQQIDCEEYGVQIEEEAIARGIDIVKWLYHMNQGGALDIQLSDLQEFLDISEQKLVSEIRMIGMTPIPALSDQNLNKWTSYGNKYSGVERARYLVNKLALLRDRYPAIRVYAPDQKGVMERVSHIVSERGLSMMPLVVRPLINSVDSRNAVIDALLNIPEPDKAQAVIDQINKEFGQNVCQPLDSRFIGVVD